MSLLEGRGGDNVSNQHPSSGGGFLITDTDRLKALVIFACRFQRCPKPAASERQLRPASCRVSAGPAGYRLSSPGQPPPEQRELPGPLLPRAGKRAVVAGSRSGGHRPLPAAAVVTSSHGQGRAELRPTGRRASRGAYWENRCFPLLPSASGSTATRAEPALFPLR